MKTTRTARDKRARLVEKYLQIAANVAAVLSAAAGALAFVVEISPWFVAGAAFIGLAAALALLRIEAKRRRELEHFMLATVKRLCANAEEAWKAAHAGQQPAPEELAALAATQRAVAQLLGRDTKEWDSLIDDLVAQAPRRE